MNAVVEVFENFVKQFLSTINSQSGIVHVCRVHMHSTVFVVFKCTRMAFAVTGTETGAGCLQGWCLGLGQ